MGPFSNVPWHVNTERSGEVTAAFQPICVRSKRVAYGFVGRYRRSDYPVCLSQVLSRDDQGVYTACHALSVIRHCIRCSDYVPIACAVSGLTFGSRHYGDIPGLFHVILRGPEASAVSWFLGRAGVCGFGT